MKQHIQNPYLFMAGLKKQGMKFKIKKTLYTMEIESDYGVFSWISPETNIPKNELFFIKVVKEDVKNNKNKITVPDVTQSEIKYFTFDQRTYNKTNCYEVDISGAYWNIAKLFLSDDVFQRGFKVGKLTRLASLGGLAKTTTQMDWNGSIFTDIHTETEDTRNLFFYCAKQTGEIIDSIRMVCDTALFFWVDAIFVETMQDVNYIYSVLDIHGLTGKTYICESIVSTDTEVTVFSSEHKKNKRVFFKERKNSNFFIGKFKDYLIL